MLVSLYPNHFCKDEFGNTHREVSLEKVADYIREGLNGLDMKTLTANTLASGDEDAYKTFKGTLPAAVFSGTFTSVPPKNTTLKQHSGLVVMDFDDVDDTASAMSALAQTAETRMAFISPSAKGVKAIVAITPIPANGAEHRAAWNAVAESLSHIEGLNHDKSGKDLRRMCYLCHDPKVHTHYESPAVGWSLEENSEKPRKSSSPNEFPPLADVLRHNEIDFTDAGQWTGNYGTGQKFQIDCPFDPTHKRPDAFVSDAGGKWSFTCSHKSCEERGWKDFKAAHQLKFPATTTDDDDDDIDVVYVNGLRNGILQPRTEKQKAEDCHDILVAQNSPETLFRNRADIVTVKVLEEPPKAETLKAESLQTEIGKRITFLQRKKGKDDEWHDMQLGSVPREVVRHLENRDDLIADFPKLRSISTHPIFWHGEIINQNGYHAPSETYLHLPKPVKIERLNHKKVADALESVYADFSFEDKGDTANEIAFALTILLKHELGAAPTPLFVRQASAPQIGKSYLHNASALLATGFRSPESQMAREQDELRKFLLPLLESKQEIIYFDNVSGYSQVDSGNLASAISQGSYQDRILGASAMVAIDTTHVNWACSGNNLRLTDELFSRAVTIRLTQETEELEKRTWTHADLHGFIKANRDKLFSALASMYLHWNEEGRPSGGGHHRFQAWCQTIGGILELYGVDSLNQNAGREKERIVQDEDPMNSFYTCLLYTSPSPRD